MEMKIRRVVCCQSWCAREHRRLLANRGRLGETSREFTCWRRPDAGGRAGGQPRAGGRESTAPRRPRRIRDSDAKIVGRVKAQPEKLGAPCETTTLRLRACLGSFGTRNWIPGQNPSKVGANREFTLTWKRDPRREWNLALYQLVPADELEITGTYVKDRVINEGIGAPLVAQRALTREEAARLFCPPFLFYSVTATAQFEGSRCIISINDPLTVDTVRVEGHTYPLAADYTASYALLLAKEKPQKLGLVRLLKPEVYADTFRVARLEPYDPNKTVILVIHGLMDTPVTWVPMLNAMRKDPYIRHNYQFWFFSYPSGYPYPYSAMVLRKELDAMEKAFPVRKKMVVIGHSMGGCISRTLVTDAGMTLWMKAFGKATRRSRSSGRQQTHS